MRRGGQGVQGWWLRAAGVVAVLASMRGGPAVAAMNKPPLPTQPQLDDAAAWRSYRALYPEIARVKSVAAVDRLRNRLDKLEPALETLFAGDPALATALVRVATLSLQGRYEAYRPKPGRQPRPDHGKRLPRTFGLAEARHRVITGFRAHGLRDPLVGDTFVAALAGDLEILAGDLDRYAQERGGAGGTGGAPAGPPRIDAPPDVAAMRRFLDQARADRATW